MNSVHFLNSLSRHPVPKRIAAADRTCQDMDTAEPQAAVAIMRARQPGESILLIRRSEREEGSWSGHWSFPGGRHDPEDPELLHTALRELEEERGLLLGREHSEAAWQPVLARRRTGPFVLVAPFRFGVGGWLWLGQGFSSTVPGNRRLRRRRALTRSSFYARTRCKSLRLDVDFTVSVSMRKCVALELFSARHQPLACVGLEIRYSLVEATNDRQIF